MADGDLSRRFLARLLVFDGLEGLDLIACIGRGDDLAVVVGAVVGDFLLDGLPGVSAEDLVVQLYGIILPLGTVQNHVNLAVMDGGLDLDGVGAVVPELVVQRSPVNRGVHAEGHVIHQEHMGRALRRLQIRLENGIVDGRGHLADTAAHLGLGLAAAGVDQRFPVALGLGSLADGSVEGELLAREDDGSVYGLAGQLQVVSAVIVGGVIGVGLGQHVLEQAVTQGLGVHLGLQRGKEDLHVLAGLGSLQHRLELLTVKAEAVLAVRDLAGIDVKLRLHGILAEALPQGLDVHGAGHFQLIAHLGLHDFLGLLRDQGQGIAVGHDPVDLLGVQLPAHRTGVDGHELGGGQLFHRLLLLFLGGLLALRRLHLLGRVLKLHGRLSVLAGVLGHEFFDLGAERILAEHQIIPRIQHVAVRVRVLPALAGIQIGSQLNKIQMNVADRVGQGQNQRFLGGLAALQLGRQRQHQILADHHIQLGETALQIRSGHTGELHRGVGGADLGIAAVLREDQNAHHQHQNAGHCGQHRPDPAHDGFFSSDGHILIVPARNALFPLRRLKFSFFQGYPSFSSVSDVFLLELVLYPH